jgi:hypothetical protein
MLGALKFPPHFSACVDDSAVSGKRFIVVPVVAAGEETKPVGGVQAI